MNRTKTFLATGLAPDGRLYAGDLNAIEDAAAALSDFAQTLDLGVLRVGQSDLQLLRYGAGLGTIASEARLSGSMRIDGIFRPLGGMILGTFTTTQRDAIGAGMAPYGTMILNSTTNTIQINTGTDGARSWQSVGGTSQYTTTIGDGSTTDFAITHSLNSQNLAVIVRENAAPYSKVFPEIEFTTVNQAHIMFDVAPTAGQYVVTFIGGAGPITAPSAHATTHGANGSDALAWGTIHGRGTLAARPAAAASNSGYLYTATDVNGGTTYRSNGASWDQIAAPINSDVLVTIGTSLPGSPYDGQEAILVDSTSAPTFSWRMKYIAAASKWLFIGGIPAMATAAGGTITNTSYVDFPTTASYTVPRAGTYLIRFGADGMYPTNGSTSVYLTAKKGAASGADADALTSQNLPSNGVTSPMRDLTVSGLSASDTIKLQGRAAVGSIVAQSLFLEVTPVLVS